MPERGTPARKALKAERTEFDGNRRVWVDREQGHRIVSYWNEDGTRDDYLEYDCQEGDEPQPGATITERSYKVAKKTTTQTSSTGKKRTTRKGKMFGVGNMAAVAFLAKAGGTVEQIRAIFKSKRVKVGEGTLRGVHRATLAGKYKPTQTLEKPEAQAARKALAEAKKKHPGTNGKTTKAKAKAKAKKTTKRTAKKTTAKRTTAKPKPFRRQGGKPLTKAEQVGKTKSGKKRAA